MSDRLALAGRRALVLGLGLTGFSAARFLHAGGAQVRVADTRARPPFLADLMRELPAVPFEAGEFTAQTLSGADLVVISPGIAKSHPAIASAVAAGVELVGDVELFARALPAGQKVIAITGSNGKSTVTALTGALCQAAGLRAVVAGNIGEPVLDALAAIPSAGPWPDVFVLELSSFQLETTASLAPVAATVLNVTDNHLDRYAGLDDYAAAKARIFRGARTQVLNRDDPRSMAMRQPQLVVETFGGSVPALEEEWGLVPRVHGRDETWLARGGQLLLPAAELKLVGRHNALNALAALALASMAVPIRKDVLGALARFAGLPHRMQRVGERDGRLFVNDSKGTTVAATRVALEGLGRPAVLIAGGEGKQQDFRPLRQAVDAHCRAVLLIGIDAPRIREVLESSPVPVESCGTLEVAVARALELARPGDAVLLSPACASYDQFANYADRGERFVALVEARREPAHA